MSESFTVMNKLAFTTRIAVDYSRENFSFKGILESKQVTKSASGSKNSKLTKWYIFVSIVSQTRSKIRKGFTCIDQHAK